MLQRRNHLPTRVTRGSRRILNSTPLPSLLPTSSSTRGAASAVMLRSLSMVMAYRQTHPLGPVERRAGVVEPRETAARNPPGTQILTSR